MTPTPPATTQRLDRWLWCARFAKSRSIAAGFCTSECVALGDVTVQKAHHPVRIGDRLTLRLGRFERRIEVLALAQRRGPASEARTLYAETTPPIPIAGPDETWSPLLVPQDDEFAPESC
jgi:ribosome-associated heat shock protein Hsp15